MEVKQGDILYLNSENGLTYKIEVISVNFYRPPEMIYAINIIDPNGNSYYMSYGDFYFCGQDFIDKCTKKND